MAFEQPGAMDGGRPAGADLSSHQFKFVKLNSSGQVILCAAATDKPYGILQNKPTSGAAAIVMRDGMSKVVCAGDNAKGNVGGTDANGLFAPYVFGTDTTKYICAEVVVDADNANGIGTVSFSCYCPPRGA